MSLSLFLWIISPILALLAMVILKDLIALLKYYKLYKGQNIPLYYSPMGLFGLLLPVEHRDANHTFNKLTNKTYKGADLLCHNQHDSTNVGLLLLKPEIIREFFVKEIKHTKRIEIVESSLNEGFFYETGEHAMNMRGVFNKFFQPENLNKLTPILRDRVDGWMKKIYKDVWKNGEENEFKRVEMRDYMPKIMTTITNEFIFGDKNVPEINGKGLPEAEEDLLQLLFNNILRNPLHLLTFGYAHKLKLFKASRDAEKLCAKMENVCRDTLLKRMEETKHEDLGCTVMDLMIKYNLTAKESDKISLKDMVGNSLAFIGAGQDTSKNTTEILLYELTTNPKRVERLVETEIPKMFGSEEDRKSYHSYFSSEYLNAVINENLRRDGPAAISFPRKVTKAMRVGKYKIYKGTIIWVNYHGCHMNEEYHENSEVFDETKFIDEKKKNKMIKGSYLPFSTGKRACIGKNFAELVIRIMLSSFFEAFETRKIEGYKRNTVNRFVKGIKDCLVEIRPKKRVMM